MMKNIEEADFKTRIDNDVILRSVENHMFLSYGSRFLYTPFLKHFDKFLKRKSREYNLSLLTKKDKENIYNLFYDTNRLLEELLGIDLGKYGY
tara:strand:+ start:2113 stop:2391 length:279 start_codon:yes stop_codon:yes gene_type:complete